MHTISAAFLLVLAVEASSAATTQIPNFCYAKPDGDKCSVDTDRCLPGFYASPGVLSSTPQCICECKPILEMPVEVCCETKTVGAYKYTKHSSGKVPANCLNDCIYTRDGQSGTKYCFASGDLEVHCEEDQCKQGPIKVNSIKPDNGSVHGGQDITIFGDGFSTTLGAVTVTIGGADCTSVSATPNSISCITPPGIDKGPNVKADVVVTSCKETAPSHYRYSTASTPAIAKITPDTADTPVLITITGANFGTDITGTTVTATSTTAAGEVNHHNCPIASITEKEITCTMPNLDPGSKTIVVKNKLGLSNNNMDFNAQ